MLFAFILVALTSIKIKKTDFHAARMIIVAIFTILFYSNYIYTTFAILVTLIALYMVNAHLNRKMAYKSAVVAVICSLISYLFSLQLGIPNL